MKMHYKIFFFLGCLIMASCGKKLFDGQYVHGTVVAKAIQDDIGFMEMEPDHDYSFMALYKGSELDGENLHDPYFFKIKLKRGVPWAYDFQKDSREHQRALSIHKHDPITSIRGHSFRENDHRDFAHIKSHMSAASLIQEFSDGGATYNVSYQNECGADTGTDVVYASGDIRLQIQNFGWGTFFIELDDEDYAITSIDTCHHHEGQEKVCRDNF